MQEHYILWLDNEEDEGFVERAKEEGLSVHRCGSYEEGVKELANNPKKYIGVILDALLPEKQGDDPGIRGRVKAVKEIEKGGYSLHYFIYSTHLKTPTIIEDLYNHGYDESLQFNKDENGEKQLLEAIKEHIENNEEIQIKRLYQNVLAITKHIGQEKLLLKFLKQHSNIKRDIANDSLNEIRTVIEAVFKKLNEIDFIPDQVYFNTYRSADVTASSKFICQHKEMTDLYLYRINSPPKIIIDLLIKLMRTTNEGSHYNDCSDYLQSDENAGFFYQSALAQLFEILIYMNRLFEKYPEKSENSNLYSKKIKG